MHLSRFFAHTCWCVRSNCGYLEYSDVNLGPAYGLKINIADYRILQLSIDIVSNETISIKTASPFDYFSKCVVKVGQKAGVILRGVLDNLFVASFVRINDMRCNKSIHMYTSRAHDGTRESKKAHEDNVHVFSQTHHTWYTSFWCWDFLQRSLRYAERIKIVVAY